MDLALVSVLLVLTLYQIVKRRDQMRRIHLLAYHLQSHDIERLMQTVLEGYERALDASEQTRREQIWAALQDSERSLASQFTRFCAAFSQVWSEQTLVSTLAWPFPHAAKFFPRQTFDMRHLIAIHADGIQAAVDNEEQLNPRDRAFRLMAELLLMQHSCHWFCRSRLVADARMIARHKTRHDQLVNSVSAKTREAYLKAIGK